MKAANLPAAAFEPRPVVVRIDEKAPQLALLIAAPAPGFFSVRLCRGGRKYSDKVRRVLAAELVRPATAEEIRRGRLQVLT